MNEGLENLTLETPPAWEAFGQWVIYGIVILITLGVLIFMFKMLFPGKDKDEE